MRRIPRLHKETSVFDGAAISDGIEQSAGTATTYLTESSSEGLMVHRSDDSDTGVRITDVVEILRDGESVAEYGDTARIGSADGVHLELDGSSVSVKGSDNTNYVRMYRANPDDPYGIVQTDSVVADDVATESLVVTDFVQLCGQNVYAIHAGSKVVTLSNGQWLTVATANELTTWLGSGASYQNCICIAQNGNHAAYEGVVTGAMGQDGTARAYIYPSHTGDIRINFVLIRFAQ